MTQHFAASWLLSLEKKLEALSEWTWTDEQRGACATHRNLFREFFNPKFQKTLALVDDQKRIAFLDRIEKNLYKFEGRTQQFPLGCLCALLQHGRDSPNTKDKIVAWVNFLLSKLREGLSNEAVKEVVEECLSDQFQKFVPFMPDDLMARLSDGLGEHLSKCDEDMQKKVMEDFSAIPGRIEQIMVTCTKELNSWLEKAPRFPSTPLLLADSLGKMQHPLLRFFNRIKDATKKESFLVAAALTLQSLRARFRWMCAIEPDLEAMRSELQARLFTVEGQGPVMDMWLSSRLKKYNVQTATKAAQQLITDPSKSQELKAKLQPLFPERIEGSPDSGWVALDVPTSLADGVLSWLIEHDPNFFVPQHTLAATTLLGILHRFGRTFEADPLRSRARLGGVDPNAAVATLVPPPAAVLPRAQFPPLPPPASGVGGAPVMVPPPAILPGTNPLLPPVAQIVGSTSPDLGALPSAPAPEVDNLVDLLLNEACESVPSEHRGQIAKMGHGIYRFGEKEVTLHTTNGQLFAYRVGMTVRNCPLRTLLQEEGLLPSQTVPGASSASVGAVDTSSVAKIASLGAQISSGVAMKTAMAQQVTMPFHRPPEQKSDPIALTSKRVEAASRAMDVAIQFARRSVDFGDEKFLRKILGKGLKYDKQWSTAYTDFCAAKGITESDHKKHDKDSIASFIERNLASSMNEDWARKVIHGGNDDEKKDKKDKKDKKKKEKKEKKRKVSESASSSPERQAAFAGTQQAPSPPVMQPPSMPPPSMHMSMEMSMFPGMPLGGMMGHPMAMGGMVFGPGMMGDGGMAPMGVEMTEDRPRKKMKADKADKQKKVDKVKSKR